MTVSPVVDDLWRVQFRARLDHGETPTFVAEGHSMWPAICDGDVVRIEPLPSGGPLVGAVVLAAYRRRLVLHRVLERRPGGLFLKGDANPNPDGWCDLDWVVGRVASRRGDWVRACVSSCTGAVGARALGFCRTRLC